MQSLLNVPAEVVLANINAAVAKAAAKDIGGKVLAIFFPILAFVVSGFEHCVANMYYIPAGLLALEVPRYAELAREVGVAVESLTWSRFFLQNLLPVTAGNLIGGCGFAALIWSVYHPRGPLERRPLAGDREAADLSVQ